MTQGAFPRDEGARHVQLSHTELEPSADITPGPLPGTQRIGRPQVGGATRTAASTKKPLLLEGSRSPSQAAHS